jgi:hypothetical protein
VDGFHDGIPIKKREKRKNKKGAMGYGKKRKIKFGSL